MSEAVRRWLRLLVTIALAAFVVGAVATADPPARDRAAAIGATIRCPVCQGESIADSPAPLARDMMSLVSELVDQGLSDEQVIERVLAAYGEDAQLLDPRLTPATVGLWAIPALALAVGVGLAMARRRPPGSREESQRRSPAVASEEA